MKALTWTAGALLLLMACTGNKNATAQEAAAEDSVAAVPVSDTLVYEYVAYQDTSKYKVKIVDYSSDEEPAPYEVKTVMDTYQASTIKVVAGKPEVVAFINQWMTIDANPNEEEEKLVTAEKVSEMYAKLKKQGVTDVLSAMKAHATSFLSGSYNGDDPDEMDEMAFESANELESSIEVSWQTPNLLTIWDSGYEYYAGAAHGMPWSFGKTFDLKNLRVLSFDDIITKAGRKALLKMIVAQLQDEYGSDDMLNAPEEIDFPGCDPSLVKEGVAFDYGAYEVGPYALGMPRVIIPYDKIKPYLTPEVKELLGME